MHLLATTNTLRSSFRGARQTKNDEVIFVRRANPESITTMVSMDSGFAPPGRASREPAGAPRNDGTLEILE
ncbi:MAG: hypothetical protein QOH32_4027 [Bradyrhizobium sp.]|jgi:hypothetical protein|nr:hypothetical protein [Bradyrhizobium sp.]